MSDPGTTPTMEEAMSGAKRDRVKDAEASPIAKIGDFFSKLGDYYPIGPKDDTFKEYEKLKFIQKNIDGINEE